MQRMDGEISDWLQSDGDNYPGKLALSRSSSSLSPTRLIVSAEY